MQFNNTLELAVKVLKEWKASPKQIQKILLDYPEDVQEERAHYILMINDFLKVHFSNPQNQTGFMRMSNHASFFKGRAPLELISTGSMDTLREVESRIRNMGEW